MVFLFASPYPPLHNADIDSFKGRYTHYCNIAIEGGGKDVPLQNMPHQLAYCQVCQAFLARIVVLL